MLPCSALLNLEGILLGTRQQRIPATNPSHCTHTIIQHTVLECQCFYTRSAWVIISLLHRLRPEQSHLFAVRQVRQHHGRHDQERERAAERKKVEIHIKHVKLLRGRNRRKEEIEPKGKHNRCRLERCRLYNNARQALHRLKEDGEKERW